MEFYNSYTSNSASSSSSSSYNSSIQCQPEDKSGGKPYRSALHSVRKNTITKKPIAPMPPTPPKIYKVSPGDFRDVVQRLTGAPDQLTIQPTRLQEVAPPPLSLSPPHRQLPLVQASVNMPPFTSVADQAHDENPSWKSVDSSLGPLNSPLGFSLSPASVAWCSSILMSPGTLSPLASSEIL